MLTQEENTEMTTTSLYQTYQTSSTPISQPAPVVEEDDRGRKKQAIDMNDLGKYAVRKEEVLSGRE